jgi:hypothetical protein
LKVDATVSLIYFLLFNLFILFIIFYLKFKIVSIFGLLTNLSKFVLQSIGAEEVPDRLTDEQTDKENNSD